MSSLIPNKSDVTVKEIAEMNKVSNSFLQILKEKRKIVEKDEENKELVNKNLEKQKRFTVKKKKVETFIGRIEINEKKISKSWVGIR